MEPGANNNTGEAVIIRQAGRNFWVPEHRLQPLPFPVRTFLKLSLYGCAVDYTGETVMLSNSLKHCVFTYQNGNLINTHREKTEHTKYGFDLTMSQDGNALLVYEAGGRETPETSGKLHVYLEHVPINT